jgi:hypothetical protein
MNEHDPLLDEGSKRELVARLESAARASDDHEPPVGIVAQSADGRVFFIPEQHAAAMEVAHGGLYRVWWTAAQAPTAQSHKAASKQAWRWLETHDPDSDQWRLRCLLYFENCV